MQDGEFANTSSNNQRRRRRKDSANQSEDYLEDVAYVVNDEDVSSSSLNYDFIDTTAQFAEKVRYEKEQLQTQKRNDLMEVAKLAGFGERVKPKVNAEEGDGVGEKLGWFESDILEDDDSDSLDVRVKFD